jgi:hypothetical protein
VLDKQAPSAVEMITRCAGTNPLQPQPTREDPDHLYSARTGEVIGHRQRDRFPPLKLGTDLSSPRPQRQYFAIDTIDRPATTSGIVTHHARPAVAATLATRSSQNSGARNARRKVSDSWSSSSLIALNPNPATSLNTHARATSFSRKCKRLNCGTKNSQPPQSSAQRRHCRTRAPGCLPVIPASVEICRDQNVIAGAKEAVGYWHGSGLPRAQ